MIRMYYIHGLCYSTHFLAWFYCWNTKFSRSLGALPVMNAPLQPSLPPWGRKNAKVPGGSTAGTAATALPAAQIRPASPLLDVLPACNITCLTPKYTCQLPQMSLLSLAPLQHPSFSAGPSSQPPVPSYPSEGQEAPAVEPTLIKWYPALVSP